MQAKGVDKTRRMFTGQEAISVVATNSIGHTTPLPVTLEQRGLCATAKFTPFTPGPLQLAVSISNEAVPSTPLQLTVGSGKISSRSCSMMPVTAAIASKLAQDLPKRTLIIVHGADGLANRAPLEPSDVEVAISPPEAVSDIELQTLPDDSIAVCGYVEREGEAVISVQGTKVNQKPMRLRPVTSDTARLRPLHVPETAPTAGSQVAFMLQACDASGAVLDMDHMKVVAEMVHKTDRGADLVQCSALTYPNMFKRPLLFKHGICLCTPDRQNRLDAS